VEALGEPYARFTLANGDVVLLWIREQTWPELTPARYYRVMLFGSDGRRFGGDARFVAPGPTGAE
jgi:hypothetical protein